MFYFEHLNTYKASLSAISVGIDKKFWLENSSRYVFSSLFRKNTWTDTVLLSFLKSTTGLFYLFVCSSDYKKSCWYKKCYLFVPGANRTFFFLFLGFLYFSFSFDGFEYPSPFTLYLVDGLIKGVWSTPLRSKVKLGLLCSGILNYF